MKHTVRLFDNDPYLNKFSSTVISCENGSDGYAVVLEATAFFPEEGGQSCDTGTLGGAAVSKVEEKDGVIVHYTDSPLEAGLYVAGEIDFDERYRKMRNHTGEHVLCGIAHRLWGAENVGFHLSEEYVRMDLDVFLDREKVALLERLANEAVTENHPVRAWYPSEEELETVNFRSKDGIAGKVRLVEIEGVDVCACCAPHVASTSEIGMIKVVDSIKYKGGCRLEIVCGSDAADMFIREHAELSLLAASYSVKREELPEAVERQRKELADVTYKLRRAERDLMQYELEKIDATEGNLAFFFDGADPENVREFLNGVAAKCRIAAGFIAAKDGYRFFVRSDKVDLVPLAKQINEGIEGRGGGSSLLLQGSCAAAREKIEEFFEKEL